MMGWTHKSPAPGSPEYIKGVERGTTGDSERVSAQGGLCKTKTHQKKTKKKTKKPKKKKKKKKKTKKKKKPQKKEKKQKHTKTTIRI